MQFLADIQRVGAIIINALKLNGSQGLQIDLGDNEQAPVALEKLRA
jgi:hypothetical protein